MKCTSIIGSNVHVWDDAYLVWRSILGPQLASPLV